MHDIDQIVALTVYFVNFGAAVAELAPYRISDAVLDNLRVRLVADSVYILASDHLVKSRSCRLQVVEGVSHVSFGSENERLDTWLICL